MTGSVGYRKSLPRSVVLAGLLIGFAIAMAAPATAANPMPGARKGVITKPAELADAAPPKKVPGVVIDHSPAASGRYIGSPSLVILPDGNYLASHDFFGPKSDSKSCATTVVFLSTDRGASWHKRAQLRCAFWSNLFVRRGAVYLMGTTKEYGRIVIRRSRDDGKTWTEPDTASTGLLTPAGHWHTAPCPVVEHAGRLWRAFENADGGTQWGKRFQAGMLSVPEDANLLVAANWTFSNFLPRNPEWLNGEFGGWLEGNAVVAPDGNVVDVLRVDVPHLPEKAAIVHISADGRRASFDPATGFINLPGGATKFTIRQDPKEGGYWTLANIVTGQSAGGDSVFSVRPASVRNTLALLYSPDLRKWEVRGIILHHPDITHHAFQYVDWQFDGNGIIVASRTSYDDGQGGAHSFHDANYLTFYRIKHFRTLGMKSDTSDHQPKTITPPKECGCGDM